MGFLISYIYSILKRLFRSYGFGHQSKFSKPLRVIALCLSYAFLLEQLVFAAPGVIKPIELSFFKEKAPIALKLPGSVGVIEDFHRAEDRTLILIQDAHTNTSGQINLSKTLDHILTQHPDLNYIFLEAGEGNSSLSHIRQYGSPQARKETSLKYLRKGELHGEEYLDITKDHNITLWGVENKELYERSLLAYREITKEREKFTTYLNKIESTIKTLKPKIYNPYLLSFDKKHESFLNEDISRTKYYDILTKEAQRQGISLFYYPHLKALSKLKKKEDRINFQRANREHHNLLESLPEEKRKELLLLAKETKSATSLLGQSKEERAYFIFLQEVILSNEKNASKDYPELFKYLEYLEESKNLNPKAILKEEKGLEERVYDSVIKTPDERKLYIVSKNLKAIENLFHLKLTPEEYATYKNKKHTFDIAFITGFLNKKIMDIKKHHEKALFLEEGYEDLLQKAEEFYNLTYQRDLHFIEETLEKMNGENLKKAVLITGGYHTPNLKSLLKEKDISFISITPQVFHETDHKRYERLLLSQNITTSPTQAKAYALRLWNHTNTTAPKIVKDLKALPASVKKTSVLKNHPIPGHEEACGCSAG